MAKGAKYSNAQKSYSPSESLINLVSELLQHEKYEKDFEGKLHAGGADKNEIEVEEQDLKRKKENLVKRKVDLLNKHIFPAMANLTVLVEQMQKHPYINDLFEDDVRALFLTKSNKSDLTSEMKDKTIFERFIEASIISKRFNFMQNVYRIGINDKVIQTPDYRLILCNIMQKAVYLAINGIIPMEPGDSKSKFFKKTLVFDLERVCAWTELMSLGAWTNEVYRGKGEKLQSNKRRRPPQF